MKKLPSHLFEYRNHEMDNTYISNIIRDLEVGIIPKNIKGYSETVHYHNHHDEYGLMFENELFETVWCHVNIFVFENIVDMINNLKHKAEVSK